MTDYAEADRRLMDWLAERTDQQLQRLLDAPEDGLTNRAWSVREYEDGSCRGCMAGWSFGWRSFHVPEGNERTAAQEATTILCDYGLRTLGDPQDPQDDGTIMRRIQSFAAAELLTRRVERKALPPAREIVTSDPLNSLYSEV